VNYIGSKKKLLDFIYQTITSYLEGPGVFTDAFAGTGVVSEKFKAAGWRVYASDIQYYSVVRLKQILLNNTNPSFNKLTKELNLKQDNSKAVFNYLNSLPGQKGFIYNNFCLGGTKNKHYQRQYFSDSNGKKIDQIRNLLDAWLDEKLITKKEYFYLLASFLEEVDLRANTASVYGAFLKHLKKSAKEDLLIKPLVITKSNQNHKVYQLEAKELVKRTSGDILYLDPPYNQRQYGANYHVLETIALNDQPPLTGKTGLRDWSSQKSAWCSKKTVLDEFKNILDNADYKIIALSYNDEGLMTSQEIKDLMSNYGAYQLHTKRYQRFRADKKKARNHRRDFVLEHLHILKKS
jgi:adenine-specific DNA-methyltransferase